MELSVVVKSFKRGSLLIESLFFLMLGAGILVLGFFKFVPEQKRRLMGLHLEKEVYDGISHLEH